MLPKLAFRGHRLETFPHCKSDEECTLSSTFTEPTADEIIQSEKLALRVILKRHQNEIPRKQLLTEPLRNGDVIYSKEALKRTDVPFICRYCLKSFPGPHVLWTLNGAF